MALPPRLIYWLSIRLWPLGKVMNRLAKVPWVGPRLQALLFRPEDSQAIIIPVNEVLQAGQSVVLPYSLLPGLIERASHTTILDHCMCWQGEGCVTYPVDLGCLFLGDGAAKIHPTLGNPTDAAGALAHVDRAMQAGLTLTVLHASLDAFMLQIPYRRMLAICFCCDCCCTIRQGMRIGPPIVWDSVRRLPGLTLRVGEGCVGCGHCTEVCPVGAITLTYGRAVIGEVCKGCGRCAEACPEGAISLPISDKIDAKADFGALIEARTEIRAGS